MARQIKWRLQFKSLNNTGCLVNIYEDGYTGSSADTTKTGADVPFAVENGVTELTGASVPFEYEEDDDENLLTPIRFKTGYINVIETESGELNDLAPQTNTSHYVEVFYGSEVAFSGFMQAQTFENDWVSSPREMSYPVMSPLGLLEYMFFEAINPPYYVGLNVLMAEVFGELRTLTNNRLKYVVYPAGTNIDISEKINSLIISPFNEDRDNTYYGSFLPLFVGISYQEFIEGICNCYGWSVREISDTIVFCKFDHQGIYSRCDIDNLSTLYNVSTNYEDGSYVLTLTDYFTLASHDGKESIVMPFEKVKLSNDGEYIKEVEFDFNHLTYNSYQVEGGYSVAWFESQTPELSGNLLIGQNYITSNGTLNVKGVVGALIGRNSFAILVNIPHDQVSSNDKFTVKFFETPTSRNFFVWTKIRYGSRLGDLKDENEIAYQHNRLTLIVKMGDQYYQGNGNWATTIPTASVLRNGITVLNAPENEVVELIFGHDDFTSGGQYEQLFAIDSISLSEQVRGNYKEYRTVISKYDTYKLSNGYGCGEESVNQLFTKVRLNSNTLGGSIGVMRNHFTNFRYMLLAQNRLQIQMKYNNSEFFDTFYLCLFEFMTTVYNGWRWRIIAVEFNPRDDEYTLTLHRSPVLES